MGCVKEEGREGLGMVEGSRMDGKQREVAK